MQETQVRSPGQEDPLQKGKATHFRILAWRIPWTEEPGDYSPWDSKEPDTTEQLTHTKIAAREQPRWREHRLLVREQGAWAARDVSGRAELLQVCGQCPWRPVWGPCATSFAVAWGPGGQPLLGTLNARAAAVTVSRCPAVRPNPGTFPDDSHHTETVTQLPEASNVRPALSPQTRKILPEKAAGSKIFLVCGLGIPFPSKSN